MALTTDQLRKLIEEKKVTIGTHATTRALKADGLKRVVIANNLAAPTREAINRYKAVGGVAVEEMSVSNDELGLMCKKPFSISVLGIKK
jgi:large subunit ribosomal protein L30e